MNKGAEFSKNRVFRYSLWRTFENAALDAPHAMFIGLNPSTADEIQDDPTVRRCINFARDWGYGGLYMMNAFAFRSTDPRGLTGPDKIGKENDFFIKKYAEKSGLIVAAWGIHGNLFDRGNQVLDLLNKFAVRVLGQNKDGTPKHPLYLKKNLKPIKMSSEQ